MLFDLKVLFQSKKIFPLFKSIYPEKTIIQQDPCTPVFTAPLFIIARTWKVKVKSLNRLRLFATQWTVAHHAPLSMGFSRQEYWSGLPFPSPMHENEVTQSCPSLSNTMDCSLPGSSIHGIFQARVLEWGAIAFSMRFWDLFNSCGEYLHVFSKAFNLNSGCKSQSAFCGSLFRCQFSFQNP